MHESLDMGEENSDEAGGWEVAMSCVNHAPPLGSA